MPPESGLRDQISSFRGDFTELAAVMQRSWGENREQPLLYTADFLRSAFEYPGSSDELATSIYSEDQLLAFAAGFPRRMRYDGREIRLLLISFVTASSQVKGAGYGLSVWRALITRARESGFDGTINFCVEGDAMNRKMPDLARLCRLNFDRIFSVEFLTRFLRPAKGDENVPSNTQEIDLFLELAASVPASVPLARIWTRDEAIWHCQLRCGALSVSATHDSRRGLIAGYLMDVAATPPAKVVFLDDLLWGTLTPSERKDLLTEFLRVAALRGAQTASCPILNYASLEPLSACGFRKSKRVLHTYLSLWNGQNPRTLGSLYVDVF